MRIRSSALLLGTVLAATVVQASPASAIGVHRRANTPAGATTAAGTSASDRWDTKSGGGEIPLSFQHCRNGCTTVSASGQQVAAIGGGLGSGNRLDLDRPGCRLTGSRAGAA
ncbi:hypothetical protein [Amycolatopsis orientalis]|uniref:hypothetical protein n=1 Tax=Amycolatopsis orientalis TaxID=31958 RepID=UPI000562DDDA|nr:hypothetical protein [Amycolatopsis orientalis]